MVASAAIWSRTGAAGSPEPVRTRGRTCRLRTTLAALSNAEAVNPDDRTAVAVGPSGDVERRRLAADRVVSIVAGERNELEATAAILDAAGRPTDAARCRARAAVLDRYLAA